MISFMEWGGYIKLSWTFECFCFLQLAKMRLDSLSPLSLFFVLAVVLFFSFFLRTLLRKGQLMVSLCDVHCLSHCPWNLAPPLPPDKSGWKSSSKGMFFLTEPVSYSAEIQCCSIGQLLVLANRISCMLQSCKMLTKMAAKCQNGPLMRFLPTRPCGLESFHPRCIHHIWHKLRLLGYSLEGSGSKCEAKVATLATFCGHFGQ